MSKRVALSIGLCGFMVTGLCFLTASQTQAANGNGPYYATPSWDQKLPASTRFVVLTDWNSEAVLDRETGLVWETSPAAGQHDWSDARFQCMNRETGNRRGWRVPSVHELASLIDTSVVFPGPTLPAGHPFTNVLSSFYWSSSTNADFSPLAWHVSFRHGVVGTGGKVITGFVWCVRGGNNADQY